MCWLGGASRNRVSSHRRSSLKGSIPSAQWSASDPGASRSSADKSTILSRSFGESVVISRYMAAITAVGDQGNVFVSVC
jgi:hypothetical protein